MTALAERTILKTMWVSLRLRWVTLLISKYADRRGGSVFNLGFSPLR